MVLLFFGYVAAHFAAYVLLFRHRAAFRRERPIFLYHAGPALAVTLTALALALAAPTPGRLAAFVLVVSLHGVYSISFLELWSLAQGGYSVNMLGWFERANAAGARPDLAELETIGSGKKADRLGGLQRLGLLQPHGPGYRLTGRGRLVAAALYGILRLANLKEPG
ncbi:MAG TPA: hypothetical protein VJ739_14170 [Gemmataceae bacterium]|nr:hypothetical protein [Gemmataceae bacterium]